MDLQEPLETALQDRKTRHWTSASAPQLGDPSNSAWQALRLEVIG